MKKIITILFVSLVAIVAAVPAVRNAERTPLPEGQWSGVPGTIVQLARGGTHYEAGGPLDGPPVVLVPGMSVPSYIWDSTFTALAQAGFRVIRYDLYGRGFSARPKVVYDRALFVGQLAELLDSLRITQPVDIIGLSLGGAITAAFVNDNPTRVRRVAFIAPFNTARDIGPLERPIVGEYIAAAVVVPGMPESQLGDFADPARFPGWVARYREQMRYRGFRAAILSTMRHFVTRDPMPDYRAVGAQQRPLLLVWGEQDSAVPFAQSAGLREALVNAEFVAVPNTGHLPHLERASTVNPLLVRFLQ